jgi:integrase
LLPTAASGRRCGTSGWDLLENPAGGVQLPSLKCVRPKWALTSQQATALVDALPPMAQAMVGLAVLSGLRRGELFALRWKDIDESGRRLSVRESVYDGTFGTPKTEAGVRQIPLSGPAFGLVLKWKAKARKSDPESLVFGTRLGTPIVPNNVLRRTVFPACDRLGLPRTTWLTFRRTYSSWSHEKGVPGKVTAQLMGHANVDTTLNVYTQVLDGSVREAVERVGGELNVIERGAARAGPLITPIA